MNKITLSLVSIIFAALIFIGSIFVSTVSNKIAYSVIAEKFQEEVARTLTVIVSSVRNDLLAGDLKSGIVTLERFRSRSFFLSAKIKRSNFEDNQSNSEVYSIGNADAGAKVDVTVLFPNSEEVWGTISFFVDDAEFNKISDSLSKFVYASSIIVALISMVLLLVYSYLLFRSLSLSMKMSL